VHDTLELSTLQLLAQASGHVQFVGAVLPSGQGTLVVPPRLAHALAARIRARQVIRNSRSVLDLEISFPPFKELTRSDEIFLSDFTKKKEKGQVIMK
jgi:hypothetical protein